MLKKILKIVGVLVALIIVLIGALCAWIGIGDVPHYEPKSLSVTRSTDAAHLEVGRHIVLERCAYCHLGSDGKLSGRQFSPADAPFGEMWTGNITQSKTSGIGEYSDGELAYLLRTGISRKGQFVGPYMSSPTLSDEDLSGIISYLRSDAEVVQASEVQPKKNAPNFLAKALLKLGMFKPFVYDSKPRPTVSNTDTVAWGRYLVQSRYECSNCHAQSFETLNAYKPEETPGYLGGGNEIIDKNFVLTKSANITPSVKHGIGGWTFDQFLTTVRTGTNPSGRTLSIAMPRIMMADTNELHAIWSYLRSVPPLENPVQAN